MTSVNVISSAVLVSLSLVSMFVFAGFSGKNNHGLLQPTNLRCANLSDPLGIDEVNPLLSWHSVSSQRAEKQTAYQVLVAGTLEKLNRHEGDLWDSQKVDSAQSINIRYNGRELHSGEECFWKVKVWDSKGNESEWSQPAKWSMGLLKQTDWQATWIGLDKLMGVDQQYRLSARYLRKEFNVPRKIKRATAYICGLGLFELYVNGKRIGDQVLAPALSEYLKRSYYMTFDLTKELNEGQNAVGVILGSGRFFAPRHTEQHYGYPKLLFQLELEYTDGTAQKMISDTNWNITTDGPITFNNEFDGEEYDAGKEMPGWNRVGFDDSRWLKAEAVAAPSERLSAQMIEPIKIMETIKPKLLRKMKSGAYIYDMGQNMVGWIALKVRASKGTAITMRFSEHLGADGELNMANLRSAKQTDVYTTNGQGVEEWEPRFTYHGFRYVELIGYPGKLDLETISGKVIYDDLKTIGYFSCSNEVINRIYQAAYWGIRGNYRSIPTDCPQRDEREGWLGDRTMGAYGETFVFNANAFYAKWITDIADAQKPSGSISDVDPTYRLVYGDDVTWPSSFIAIPGHLYQQFGNLQVIAENYGAMQKWVWYMRDKYLQDYLLPKDSYGDWCMPPRDPKVTHREDRSKMVPGDYLGSTYFYYCLQLMTEYARLLNKNEDANEYASLAEKVRAAINHTYLDKDRFYYANNTVTANAVALSLGIPPQEIREKVFTNLVDITVHDYNYHTSCGAVGQQWLMRTLTNNGRPDLALRLAKNKTYPSWGYMIEKGATTIWELWNGDTAPPSMNSANHVMLLGDLLIWLYEDLAGIKADPAAPGFKHIIMKPYPLKDLKFVRASHLSVYGPIESEWRLQGKQFRWDLSIPPNTTATIYVPAKEASEVTENGKKAAEAVGVKFLKLEAGRAVYEVSSGSYHFVSKSSDISDWSK